MCFSFLQISFTDLTAAIIILIRFYLKERLKILRFNSLRCLELDQNFDTALMSADYCLVSALLLCGQ